LEEFMDRKEYSRPVDLGRINITDSFWNSKQELVRREVIPYQWEALNDRVEGAAPSFCMHNFKAAAKLNERIKNNEEDPSGKKYEAPRYTFRGFEALPEDPKDPDPDKFYGFVFQDTDFSKWIEAVGYSLTRHPDKELEKTADEAIDIVCAAQLENGYLDTYYILNGMDRSFTNLRDHHELYCLGHLLEGAVSYYQATGKDKLLKAAMRFADYVYDYFGKEEGKCQGYPGHEIAEMALARLYEATGEKKYLELAKYFIDERGTKPFYFDIEEKERVTHDGGTYRERRIRPEGNWFERNPHWYHQSHKQVREQDEAVGHAVRAVYLYSGMADVARLEGDEALYEACNKLWDSIVSTKLYITGGIGATHMGEAFSYPYDLPNDTAYSETCAAIGLVFFARRMLQIKADRKYSDVMEMALYNTVLAGMAMDGKSFFYVNPLEVDPTACDRDERKLHVKSIRQKWFGCACCPPNIARLLSSIGAYAFTESEDTFFTHLYMGGTVESSFGGKDLTLNIESSLPWEGDCKVRVKGDNTAARLAFRIPSWSRQTKVTVKKDGEEKILFITGEGVLSSENEGIFTENGYLYIDGSWNEAEIDFEFAMEVMVLRANNRVREDVGRLAVRRGPFTYCLEEKDNGPDLQLLHLDRARFENEGAEVEPFDKLDKGLYMIKLPGIREKVDEEGSLYLDALADRAFERVSLKFVPYYAWNNRGQGEMSVFVRN
jgi:hypothetical protein